MLRSRRIVAGVPIILLALAIGGEAPAQAPPAQRSVADPVDEARAATRNRALPKTPPAAVGTPPIITERGSSVRGASVPSKASKRPKRRTRR